METLLRAFAYKSWSNERVFEAFEKLSDVDTQTFVTQQLNHLIIVEDLFRARLLGESQPHKATNSTQLPPYNEIKQRLIDSARWYFDYVSSMDDAKLSQRYTFTFADGLAGDMNGTEMMFHIIQHGAYHRGSIARALDLAGVEHPADSFTIYLHEAEPQRRLQGGVL